MTFASEILSDVQSTINNYGEPVRFRRFTRTFNTGSYDDEVLLTSGVDIWCSGLVQPIGKNEAHLVQQGRLFMNDLVVYVDGSVSVSGLWKLGIGSGSPPAGEYVLTDENLTNSPQLAGSIAYHKMFLRKLTNGSIVGE